MSDDDRHRTIGELARRGAMLRASCGACAHTSEVDPLTLPMAYCRKRLAAVRFKCAKCGRRGAAIEVFYPRRAGGMQRALGRLAARVREFYDAGGALYCRCGHCHPTADVFYTIGEIERQLNMVDPRVSEAAARLRCPSCYRPVFIGAGEQESAAAPRKRDRLAGRMLD